MSVRVRVIPCLDVANGRVVKGVNFVDLADAGDPVEAARAYDAAGADELCFLDITASHEARGGMVATRGWADISDVPVVEMAESFEDAGVAALLFTDVGRDGLLKGCNMEATVDLARRTAVPVIASGGVAGLDELRALGWHAVREGSRGGIEGVIVGRALYNGRIDLAAALAVAAG